jgi:acetylornithine/N-succinyldiaminopimelate aminotransferase
VRELGAQLREGLLALDGVNEVRGRGLMAGVGLENGVDATALGASLLERGLIVNVPEPGTLRLLPPLTVDSAQIQRAIALIGDGLSARRP